MRFHIESCNINLFDINLFIFHDIYEESFDHITLKMTCNAKQIFLNLAFKIRNLAFFGGINNDRNTELIINYQCHCIMDFKIRVAVHFDALMQNKWIVPKSVKQDTRI